jgi:hypothetical protein
MVKIDALEVDEHILDKIETRHGLSWEEVEEACLARARHVRRGRDGLYLVFSTTEAGRHVLVVLAAHGGNTWKLVTAREMTPRERRLYREHRGA